MNAVDVGTQPTPGGGGKERGKGGRPALPPDRLRSLRLDFDLSVTERARLDALAAQAGRNVRSFARARALDEPIEIPAPIPEINQEAWRGLAGTGNLLDRLIHHLERGGQPEVEPLVSVVAELRSQVTQLRAELVGMKAEA
jgi:hypothetical protein